MIPLTKKNLNCKAPLEMISVKYFGRKSVGKAKAQIYAQLIDWKNVYRC